jgi:hypothetical protein
LLPPSTADHPDPFAGAREELERFLTDRAGRIEHREQRESARLLEANALLREENARLLEETEKLKAVSRLIPRALGDARHHQQPAPPPDNVIPIRDAELERLASRSPPPKSAVERAEAERAKRDHINASSSGGGVPGGVLGQPLPEWWGR